MKHKIEIAPNLAIYIDGERVIGSKPYGLFLTTVMTVSDDDLKRLADRCLEVISDRKTKNCSEKPNNCETCKYGEDKQRYAHVCNECGVGINNYEPKDEPTGYNLTPVEDEPQTCSFSDCDNFKNPDYERCIECKRKQIKLKTEQTERSE